MPKRIPALLGANIEISKSLTFDGKHGRCNIKPRMIFSGHLTAKRANLTMSVRVQEARKVTMLASDSGQRAAPRLLNTQNAKLRCAPSLVSLILRNIERYLWWALSRPITTWSLSCSRRLPDRLHPLTARTCAFSRQGCGSCT